MKNFKKVSFVYALCLMLLAAPIGTFASGKIDKTTEKARELVSSCAPDDWQSFAEAAKMCINKEVNLTEAKGWFEKSLSINESAMGHEVAGDYYVVSKLYSEAVTHYVKSMKLKKEKSNTTDLSDLQAKIETAVIQSKQ
ncbi:MAG: hypothetical protein AAF519_17350 [Bacteroidota bacterium]